MYKGSIKVVVVVVVKGETRYKIKISYAEKNSLINKQTAKTIAIITSLTASLVNQMESVKSVIIHKSNHLLLKYLQYGKNP